MLKSGINVELHDNHESMASQETSAKPFVLSFAVHNFLYIVALSTESWSSKVSL